MTFMLNLSERRQDPPAMTEQVPTFGEQYRAQFGASQIEQDAWGKSNRVRREVREELSAALEGYQIPEDPNRRQNARTGKSVEFQERALLEQIQFRSAEDPETFRDLPKNEEEFRAEVNRRLLQEYEGLIGTAAAGPSGRVGARTLGGFASGAMDEATLLTLPLGLGAGTLPRIIASEAVLGAGGEALMLPRQFRMAERLEIEAPNAPLQIGVAAATAGVLGGGIAGATRFVQYRMGKSEAVAESRPEGQSQIEYERAVEQADQELREGRRPPASTRDPEAVTIDYDLKGKIRNLPVSDNFLTKLRGVVAPLGDNIGVVIVSGGQHPAGSFGRRVGSTRHDVDHTGHAHTADLVLTRNGRRIRPAEDKELYARFFRNAGAVFEGIGHYPWGVHVGGGSRAAWGPSTTAQSLDPYFKAAIEAGRVGWVDWEPPALPGGSAPSAREAGVGGGPTSRGYTGTGSVTAGDDLTIDVQYEVVDASVLRQASGDLQPRDRSRVSSDEQIAELAARLDPVRLMPSPEADRGAPVVGPDSIIESGNGRVRAIQRAAERYPDRFQAYIDQIREAGFDIPEGVGTPVLIARRTSDLDIDGRQRFVRQANSSAVARMSATERAASDARAIDESTLQLFDPAQPMSSRANRAFVTRMLNALPQSERNGLTDQGGQLNREGQQRLSEALFARAYDAPDILSRFTETEAGQFRSLLDALSAAAPQWAALRADIAAGLVRPEMDITPFLLDAMRTIAAARDIARTEGGTAATAIDALLGQADLLEGAVAPLTAALVRKFAPAGRSVPSDRIAAFLNRYADEARKVGTTGEGLLGEGPDVIDILQAIDGDSFADLTETGRPMVRDDQVQSEIGYSDPQDLARFDQGAQSQDLQAANQGAMAELRTAAEAAQNASMRPVEDPATLTRDLRMAQPFDDLDGLYQLAPEVQKELETAGRQIAADLGVEFKTPGIKQRATADEKMSRKRYATPRQMTDIARAGFSVRTAGEADAVVDRLAQVAEIVDEGWGQSPAGYVDRKVIWRAENGMLAEIQIWPQKMLEAKAGEGTDLYTRARASQDDAEIADLNAQQSALYSAAIEASDQSFANVLGKSNSPNVAANFSLNASGSGTTRDVSNTSAASTSSQFPPGSSSATAFDGDSITAGRPSQSANTSDVMGDTSTQDISADRQDGNTMDLQQVREELDLAGVDLRAITFRDDAGVEVSMADYIDDLEQDETLMAAVEACQIRGAG